ncbi:MAG: hypothetical protein H6740_07490 [Alphaproteobacteria bacterium]|nr:hypothetical protein [Alphaproteobacteria bacterium]
MGDFTQLDKQDGGPKGRFSDPTPPTWGQPYGPWQPGFGAGMPRYMGPGFVSDPWMDPQGPGPWSSDPHGAPHPFGADPFGMQGDPMSPGSPGMDPYGSEPDANKDPQGDKDKKEDDKDKKKPTDKGDKDKKDDKDKKKEDQDKEGKEEDDDEDKEDGEEDGDKEKDGEKKEGDKDKGGKEKADGQKLGGGGGGGEGPDERLPPIPLPRLGGVAPPSIGEPPTLTAEQIEQLRQKTGKTPRAHHARVRAQVQKIARLARRTQAGVVQDIEGVAFEVQRAIERRAAEIPPLAAALIGRVNAAFDEAINAVKTTALEATALLDKHAKAKGDDVKSTEEDTLAEVEAALAKGSKKMVEAYNAVKAKFVEIATKQGQALEKLPKEHAKEFKGNVEGLVQKKRALKPSTSEYTPFYEEGRAIHLPSMAKKKQQALEAGASARGKAMYNEQAQAFFGKQFLMMSDRSAVVSGDVKRADDKSAKDESKEKGLRLANAYERGLQQITATRDQVTKSLEASRKQLIKGIQKAARKAHKSLMKQAAVARDTVMRQAAPAADQVRAYMTRMRKMFPPGQLYTEAQWWPKVAKGPKQLQQMREGLVKGAERTAKGSVARAEALSSSTKKSLRRMVSKTVESVTETRHTSVLGMQKIALEYGGNIQADAKHFTVTVPKFKKKAAKEAEDKRPAQVQQAMMAMLVGGVPAEGAEAISKEKSIQGALETQVKNYLNGTSKPEKVPGLKEQITAAFFEKGIKDSDGYKGMDTEGLDRVRDRARKFEKARDHTTALIFGGTDEELMLEAVSSPMMSKKEAYALQKNYKDRFRRDAIYVARDELENQRREDTVVAALQGNNAKMAKLILDSPYLWSGSQSKLMKDTLRGLSAKELAEMKKMDGWDKTQASVLRRFQGTDLTVAKAFLDGDKIKGMTIEFNETVKSQRVRNNQTAVVDETNGLEAKLKQAYLTEFRDATAKDPVDKTTYDEEGFKGYKMDFFRQLAIETGAVKLKDRKDTSVSDTDVLKKVAAKLTEDTVTRQVTYGRGKQASTHTYTYKRPMSETAKGAVSDILVHGPSSPVARGAKLAFEVDRAKSKGMSESTIERVHAAGTDHEFNSAKLAWEAAKREPVPSDPEKAKAHDRKLKALEQRFKEAEKKHQEFLASYAKRSGNPDAAKDPAAAQKHAVDTLSGLFAHKGKFGQEFARTMVTDGRPSMLSAYMLATDKTGTHETLLKTAFKNRSPYEVANFKTRYANEVAKRPWDKDAWKRDLHSELDPDDAHEVLKSMKTGDGSDASIADASLMDHKHYIGGSGAVGKRSMKGTPQQQVAQERHDKLTRLLTEKARKKGVKLKPGESIYNADGSMKDKVKEACFKDGRFDADSYEERLAFRELASGVGVSANDYKDALERQESFWTGLIGALAAIVTLVALFIPGVNVLVVGLITAAVAGALTIATKTMFRGSRYGNEELMTDLAMTGVDMATAALGGAKFLQFARLGAVGGAMAREAITGAIGSMAHTALRDETWHDGFWTGMGRVGVSGARGAAVSAVTAGVSEGLAAKLGKALKPAKDVDPNLFTKIGNKLGPMGRRVVTDGISEGLGAMAGEAAGLTFDVSTGQFHGSFEDALAQIGAAGVRDMVTGSIRGGLMHRNRRVFQDKKKELLARDHPPSADEMKALRRMAISAGEQGLFGASGFAKFKAEFEVSRQLLADIPPAFRDRFAELPMHGLIQVHDLIQSGQVGDTQTRLDLFRTLKDHGVDVDMRSLRQDLQDAGLEAAKIKADLRQQRKARGALAEGLPGPLRKAFVDLPLDIGGQLPKEGLQKLAALIGKGEGGTPAQRAELLKLAKTLNPDVDPKAFLQSVDAAVAAGRKLKDDARAKRREAIQQAPEGARQALASVPEAQLPRLLDQLASGELGTPQAQESLYRKALAQDPQLDRAQFFEGLKVAADAGKAELARRREAQKSQKAKELSDFPVALRGGLAELPAGVLDTVRLLALRGETGSPQERASLLARALQADPKLDPRRVLALVDQAVAATSGPRTISKDQRRALTKELLAEVPGPLRAQLKDTPLLVVSAERFEALTRSAKGDAVTLLIHGQPTVVLREGADPKVLREEGVHLVQSRHPDWAHRVGRLDESHLADWDKLPLSEQLALYKQKIEVEIDAQAQLARSLAAEMGATKDPTTYKRLGEQLDAVDQALSNLTARLDEVKAIGPFKRAAMRLGREPKPDFLDQPPRLFSKHSDIQTRIELTTGVLKQPGDEAEMSGLKAQLRALEEADLSRVQRIDELNGVKRSPHEEAEYQALKKWYEEMQAQGPVHTVKVKGERTEQFIDNFGNLMTDAAGKPVGYKIPYAYDVHYFAHGVTQIKMKIHLDPEATVTAAGLEKLKANAIAGVDRMYNNQHEVPGLDGRPTRLQVEVEFVSNPADAHATVKVGPGDGPAFQSKWYVDGDPITHAHELGHQLGLIDEYVDHGPHGFKSATRQAANSPGVKTDKGLMTNYWAVDAAGNKVAHPDVHLAPRYLEAIVADIHAARGPRTDMELQIDQAAGLNRHMDPDYVRFREYMRGRERGDIPEPVRPRLPGPPEQRGVWQTLRDVLSGGMSWVSGRLRALVNRILGRTPPMPPGHLPSPEPVNDVEQTLQRLRELGVSAEDAKALRAVLVDEHGLVDSAALSRVEALAVFKEHGKKKRAQDLVKQILELRDSGVDTSLATPLLRMALTSDEGLATVAALRALAGHEDGPTILAKAADVGDPGAFLRDAHKVLADGDLKAFSTKLLTVEPEHAAALAKDLLALKDLDAKGEGTLLPALLKSLENTSGADAVALTSAAIAALGVGPKTHGQKPRADWINLVAAALQAREAPLAALRGVEQILTGAPPFSGISAGRLRVLTEALPKLHGDDVLAVMRVDWLHPTLSLKAFENMVVTLQGLTANGRVRFHAALAELSTLSGVPTKVLSTFLERGAGKVAENLEAYEAALKEHNDALGRGESSTAPVLKNAQTPYQHLEAVLDFLKHPPPGVSWDIVLAFAVRSGESWRSTRSTLEGTRELLALLQAPPRPPLKPISPTELQAALDVLVGKVRTGSFDPVLAVKKLQEGMLVHDFIKMALDPNTAWGGVLKGTESTLRGIAGEMIAEELARMGEFTNTKPDDVETQVTVWAKHAGNKDQERRPDLLLTWNNGKVWKFGEVKAYAEYTWLKTLEAWHMVEIEGKAKDKLSSDEHEAKELQDKYEGALRLISQLQTAANAHKYRFGKGAEQPTAGKIIEPPVLITSNALLKVLLDNPHLIPALEGMIAKMPKGTDFAFMNENDILNLIKRLGYEPKDDGGKE